MSRTVCLVIALGCLAAAPGCSSCLGGSCRRPSFMEFRSPCRGDRDPCHHQPSCEPMPACGPACGPAPCCEEGSVGMPAASGPMIVEQGTFS